MCEGVVYGFRNLGRWWQFKDVGYSHVVVDVCGWEVKFFAVSNGFTILSIIRSGSVMMPCDCQ